MHTCSVVITYVQFCSLYLDAAVNSGELWFVNFYSPRCSHCHDLAPTVCIASTKLSKCCSSTLSLLSMKLDEVDFYAEVENNSKI